MNNRPSESVQPAEPDPFDFDFFFEVYGIADKHDINIVERLRQRTADADDLDRAADLLEQYLEREGIRRWWTSI